MNNQIVEISEEHLGDVVGGMGTPSIEQKEYGFFKKLALGLVKPFGVYGNTKDKTIGEWWSYKDVGDLSLGNENSGDDEFSWVSALGTAITNTAIISGIMAAGHFVFGKIKTIIE